MAGDRTHGYDLVLQLSENGLTEQFADAAIGGMLFPPELGLAVDTLGIDGELRLRLAPPVIDLDRPSPQIGLTVDFAHSGLEVVEAGGGGGVVAPLGGVIELVGRVIVRSEPGARRVALDLAGDTAMSSLSFDAASVSRLEPLLSRLGVDLSAAREAFASLVLRHLAEEVGRIDLSLPIPVADDSDCETAFEVEVTTVNDTGSADRDALVVAIRNDPATVGRLDDLDESLIPPGGDAAIVIANEWLLGCPVRNRLAARLGIPAASFDPPLRLSAPVAAPGGEGTLTNLEAQVVDNRIRFDGRATDSGTGWSAVVKFSFFVDLELEDGELAITASPPTVDTDIDYSFAVRFLTGGVGAVLGGLAGALTSVLIAEIVKSVAEGFANQATEVELGEALGEIPSFPLGPLASGMIPISLKLDDLELRGRARRSLTLPVKSQGGHVASGPFAVDLDSGRVFPGIGGGVPRDLGWEPERGLVALNGAGMTVAAVPYGVLTPLQLGHMTFGGRVLPTSAIPLSPGSLPLFSQTGSELALGVRTNQGRLAKVRVWRELGSASELHLEWITFDNPIPALDVALRWRVLERGEATAMVNPKLQSCERYDASRQCTIEAWPRLVAFPIDYQWCLCGETLAEGEGTVEHAGGTLFYDLSKRRLSLETQLGDDVECELCVSAIDARGRELFTCVTLEADGVEVDCGPERQLFPKVVEEVVPCDPLLAVDTWESFGSDKIQRQIAAAGRRARARD